MRSLLDALQAGRLIELTDSHKTKALEYLAALIEAIPDIGVEGGITESVLARENLHNTGIGKGWACPHARALHGDELVCSVGWSPAGIDYGAPDNEPVHSWSCITCRMRRRTPTSRKFRLLAKAIQTQPALQRSQIVERSGRSPRPAPRCDPCRATIDDGRMHERG